MAQQDLAEIRSWLSELPARPSPRLGRSLQRALHQIADNPKFSPPDSALTLLSGQEIRSRNAGNYRIYYRSSNRLPEIIAILHHAQDASSILHDRLQ